MPRKIANESKNLIREAPNTIGISGKTHGEKIEKKPKKNARASSSIFTFYIPPQDPIPVFHLSDRVLHQELKATCYKIL